SDHYVGEAKRSFRPELFNRIDHVVPFEALPAAAIRAIADRQLDALRRRQGLHQRGLSLSIPGDVASWLAERGTDPRFGARPLKRSIETNLVAPLARHLSGLGRVHAGEISARKTGDGLDIALTPSDASQRAGLESLHRCVEQIGELRLLLQGCVRSPAIRDLRIEVRRVERMLANPRFVRGHASLLQAMSGHEADRQLLSDIHTLVAHTESLEELAYEMRLARDVGSMESLGRERREGLQKLRELGLKLSGRGVQSPDRAALVFSWRKQPRLLSTLVRAYASLASEMQWSVALHEPTEVPRAEVEDATELSYTLEERIRLEPAQLSQSRQRRLVPDEPMATLVFRGPAAGTLLAGEAGLHRLHDRDGGTEEVRVGHASDMFLAGVYTDDELVRARAKLPRSLVRVIHHGRRTVEDKHLGLHFALEPRLERIYQRFMYARVFDTVFFRGAHRVLRRV
ncbi:MAG TPA: ATP-dependent Clp protease ATP-binding subunit, partial [Polyangiaceae bacterium]|nr:ATP-dependent Clp protease ATP-binding subunit [Polyangiaceae bacterium]